MGEVGTQLGNALSGHISSRNWGLLLGRLGEEPTPPTMECKKLAKILLLIRSTVFIHGMPYLIFMHVDVLLLSLNSSALSWGV